MRNPKGFCRKSIGFNARGGDARERKDEREERRQEVRGNKKATNMASPLPRS